eukprot:TRINITY_DN11235_c0_g1_i1.p1 TRINITY_DN11235_c0_g1~~TRINITY_DN11235_c0_g1_i1.p1  ORF type:complete len:371 (+),score=82.56 TRINITY_DN11235_c0_g1_i1:49-1161(+)
MSSGYTKEKAHQNAIKDSMQDRDGPRREPMFFLPGFVVDMIKPMLLDERDILIASLMMNIGILVIPTVIYFFLFSSSHLFGLVYLICLNFFFTQRFILMLHFSEHRKVFRPEYDYLNKVNPIVFAPFFGIPSGVYAMHHCIMHHIENNVFPWDISSTEPYNRGSIFGYLRYLGFWSLTVWVLVPTYLYKRKKMSFFKTTIKNIAAFALFVFLCYQINPVATLWVYIIPLGLSVILLSFGNFSQHIFIDPENPKSNYGLTYNAVNCLDNTYTFNDGYHIIHHQNSRLHWSELPDKFCKSLDDYENNGALNFKGIGFFDVGILVMTGQLEKLAGHYIQLGDKEKSTEEIVQMLKKRLQPIYYDDNGNVVCSK